jgi:hypothetical protein
MTRIAFTKIMTCTNLDSKPMIGFSLVQRGALEELWKL